ncbi:unnamed protein product [Camellia sinensis]
MKMKMKMEMEMEREKEKEKGEGTGRREKKTGERICKRCKQTYNPSSNSSSSCCFHPSFFVCRRHDDQKRTTPVSYLIDGQSLVQKCLEMHWVTFMYYELGPEDPPYAAKFYDCCGAEDPEAAGCTTSFHASYDDD